MTIAAVAVGATGCDNQSGVGGNNPAASVPALSAVTSTATSSATPAAEPQVDYARLLLQAGDISTPTDAYTAQPPTVDPDGRPGAEVLMVNQEQTKAVNILLVALPNPATAPAALAEAQANLATTVTGGRSQPSPVGARGTVVSGISPDGTKSVAVLLFTEGNTLARIEFDGVPGQPAPSAFVTDVGQKQGIALRVGLPAQQSAG